MYQIPNWLLCLLVVFTFTALSLLGWHLTRKWVSGLRLSNEVVGFFMGAVGMLYAVLLAMIAVASWNNYTQTEALVAGEARLAAALFRDLDSYPQELRDALQPRLRNYVKAVVETEWPALQAGEDDPRAQLEMDTLLEEWLTFSPKDEVQRAVHSEALGRMSELINTRHDRIQTGVSGILPVLWLVVVVGAFINVGLTYLLWIEDRRLHQILTIALGITFGLVVYLILAMDHPLWGKVSVSPAPFLATQDMMDIRLDPARAGHRRHAALQGGAP